MELHEEEKKAKSPNDDVSLLLSVKKKENESIRLSIWVQCFNY